MRGELKDPIQENNISDMLPLLIGRVVSENHFFANRNRLHDGHLDSKEFLDLLYIISKKT